jgi:hypothetical protein
MIRKQIFLPFIFTSLFFSPISFADLIIHNDYTLNTNTNIVTHENTQWLQWDATLGLTIEQALANNSGWRLANSIDLRDLYLDFFPDNSWKLVNTPNTDQFIIANGLNQDIFENFTELFGETSGIAENTRGNNGVTTNGYKQSSAVYGLVNYVDDNYFKIANVSDDWTFDWDSGGQYLKVGAASAQGYGYLYSGYSTTGVALIRTTVVPAPSIISILLLSLILLVSRKFISK